MKKITLPTEKIIKSTKVLSKYLHIVTFLFYSILIGIIINQSGNYARKEPTESQVNETIKKASQSKINQSSLDKLKELESRNVSLEALFDNGRTNPFEN